MLRACEWRSAKERLAGPSAPILDQGRDNFSSGAGPLTFLLRPLPPNRIGVNQMSMVLLKRLGRGVLTVVPRATIVALFVLMMHRWLILNGTLTFGELIVFLGALLIAAAIWRDKRARYTPHPVQHRLGDNRRGGSSAAPQTQGPAASTQSTSRSSVNCKTRPPSPMTGDIHLCFGRLALLSPILLPTPLPVRGEIRS
jgi:hypothetical protein